MYLGFIEIGDVHYGYNMSNVWNSIATLEITTELSSFQLSPQISFEAVTFDLPIKMEVMNDWLIADK